MYYSMLMGVRGQPQLSITTFVLPPSRAEGLETHTWSECWGSELRPSHLHGKHFTHGAISLVVK